MLASFRTKPLLFGGKSCGRPNTFWVCGIMLNTGLIEPAVISS